MKQLKQIKYLNILAFLSALLFTSLWVACSKEVPDFSKIQEQWSDSLIEQHKNNLQYETWSEVPNKYLMKTMTLSCQIAFLDFYAELNKAMRCERNEDCTPLQIWYPLSCGKTVNKKYEAAIGNSSLAEYLQKCYDWKSDEEKCPAAKDYENVCDEKKKLCVLGESNKRLK